MTSLRVDIPGTPIPQGSKVANRHGRGVRDTNAATLKPWRQHMTDHITHAIARNRWTTLDEPVEVWLVFLHPRPQHHYGTGRNEGKLKAAAPLWKPTRPDIDKLTRAALDSLTTARAITDDALVARLIAEDRYTNNTPGVIITIRPLPPT